MAQLELAAPENFGLRTHRSVMSFRKALLLVFAGMAALFVFWCSQLALDSGFSAFSLSPGPWDLTYVATNGALLGALTKIYVVSLPNRVDRREQMEELRRALEMTWSYVDATDTRNEIVDQILRRVRLIRQVPSYHQFNNMTTDLLDEAHFRWPDGINALATSNQTIDVWGSDFWTFNETQNRGSSYLGQLLACATKNYSVVPGHIDLPEYKILTPARIACWHSHMSVIQSFVDEHSANDDNTVALVLEDDVDMERDIRKRVRYLWGLLPTDWDIVFLGGAFTPRFLTWRHNANQP